MIPLLDLMLVCGVCYVGVHVFIPHRAKPKMSWLVPPPPPSAPRQWRRGCSHLYIIRCWDEAQRPGGPRVMRYTLEDPDSGRREGYTTAEALVRTLAQELRDVSAPLPVFDPSLLTPRQVLVH